MKDMYYQGIPPAECPHPHPDWTEYHCHHPEASYYMTAYDIACLHGYEGTEEEWLKSLQGLTNYEIYMKHHPDSTLTEAEWEAVTDAAKLEAMAAAETAVDSALRAELAADAAEAEKDAAVAAIRSKGVETLASIPDDYATLAAKVAGLQQRVLANGVGLSLRLRKNRTTSRWFPKQIGHVPDLNDFYMDGMTEIRLDNKNAETPVYIANTPRGLNVSGCFLRVTKYQYDDYVMQEMFPFDENLRGQVWCRIFDRKHDSNAVKLDAWFLLTGTFFR